jgi:sugar lactone lactonase YvrE
MTGLIPLLAIATLGAPLVAAAEVRPGPPGILDIALQTREARLAGDNPRWLALAREVQARAPEHVDLLISLARAHAANGRVEDSLPWLEQAVRRGAGFDLFAFPEFKDRSDHAGLKALAARAAANQAPVSPAEVFLTIDNADIRPEGITFDADSARLFIGSLNGEIWAVGLDRKLARFAGPEHGLREVLGLKVDRRRRLLWAVTGVFPDLFPPPGGPKKDEGLTGVVAFHLGSGERVRECWLDERPVLHGFNDLALAANGDVYVSDSRAGAIWRLPGGDCRLEKLLEDERMGFPNGIALSADESRLYVAHIEGLSAVELKTGERTQLAVPADASVNSMDGLVRDGLHLIGIQATPYLARVVRIRLSADGRSVQEAATVSSRPPPGVSQTTGTVAGRHYYSVAGAIDPLQPGDEGDRRARILRFELR